MAGIENWFLDIITNVYDVMGWPGVVFLMGIESAAIPFPSELIMPLAGWLLIEAKGDSAWMLWMAAFYGALGNLLGSWVAYWISYKGGRPLLKKYGKYRQLAVLLKPVLSLIHFVLGHQHVFPVLL